MDRLHFVNPCANGAAMAFGLVTATLDSKDKSEALTQLSEIVSVRASIFGRPTSGFTQTSMRLARSFREGLPKMERATVLANLAFYGADAMRLLCVCICNRLQSVDRSLVTGRVEEAAGILIAFIEPIQQCWETKGFDTSQDGIEEQSRIWTSHLRRLCGSLELADTTSPHHLPFRRLREATGDDCCVVPSRDGWLVTTYPTTDGEMFTIGEGRDVPQAVADALTSLSKNDEYDG